MANMDAVFDFMFTRPVDETGVSYFLFSLVKFAWDCFCFFMNILYEMYCAMLLFMAKYEQRVL